MGAGVSQSHPIMMSLLRSGLSGAAQGLGQMGNPSPQFNFAKLQQGIQPSQSPLGQGITPNAKRVQGMNPFSQNPMWGGDPNINGGFYT